MNGELAEYSEETKTQELQAVPTQREEMAGCGERRGGGEERGAAAAVTKTPSKTQRKEQKI